MADKKIVAAFDDKHVKYEIKIKGHLDKHWSEWMGDLKIAYDDAGNTLLFGHVADQAALHGILTQIRDLGLTLISLTPQT